MSHETQIVAGQANRSSVALPAPRVAIAIRPGTIEDVPFLDSLQKLHTKQVGWMPTAQFEGKIRLGHVLVAEQGREISGEGRANLNSFLAPDPSPLAPVPVGYCIGNDQYFKRDDVGIIYQLNVLPGKQRGLIGASLLKAMFDRAAYGCRLFCCWCAQDIAANHFWEACGFVPLAFRAGSEKKHRVHIFWQKRIREGDTTTPWWFPSQTTGGSMMEDRLVFPIPPDTHWSDAKPIVLPRDTHRDTRGDTQARQIEDRIEDRAAKRPRKTKVPVAIVAQRTALSGGLMFQSSQPTPANVEKPKREKKQKVKNDPKFVAAARELRDRWLEKVNEDPSLLASEGKYVITRAIEARQADADQPRRQLPLAA